MDQNLPVVLKLIHPWINIYLSLWLLTELRAIADKVIPEMNRDLEDENEKLKAELDAASREIELKMEKIAQLENLDKVRLRISFTSTVDSRADYKLTPNIMSFPPLECLSLYDTLLLYRLI